MPTMRPACTCISVGRTGAAERAESAPRRGFPRQVFANAAADSVHDETVPRLTFALVLTTSACSSDPGGKALAHQIDTATSDLASTTRWRTT